MRSNSAVIVSAVAFATAMSACASNDPSAPVPSSKEWQVEAVEESISSLWTADDDVFAVGSSAVGGTIAHWDGHSWRRIDKPGAQSVVSGTGRKDVWVGGHGAVLHYSGASWSMPYQVASGGTSGLLSLAAASGELWFGGELTRVEDRAGHVETSSLFHLVAGSIEAVDCCGSTGRIDSIWTSGGDDVWVLDHGQPVRFDGITWTRPSRDGSAVIRKVWGTSARDVWFVGDDFFVAHWDGEHLTSVALPSSAHAGSFHDVSGAGPNDVWAVGTSGTVVHYDGARWTIVAIPTTATLRAVHVGARVWVGGDHIVASTSLGGT